MLYRGDRCDDDVCRYGEMMLFYFVVVVVPSSSYTDDI